jgi:hypothetical protein
MFQNRGFTENRFQELNRLLSRLEAVGAVPVFVQTPVPSYIRENFPLYEEYRAKTKYLSARKDVHVVDLSEQFPDQDFSDDAHPIASAEELWTEELASALLRRTAARWCEDSGRSSRPRRSFSSNIKVGARRRRRAPSQSFGSTSTLLASRRFLFRSGTEFYRDGDKRGQIGGL